VLANVIIAVNLICILWLYEDRGHPKMEPNMIGLGARARKLSYGGLECLCSANLGWIRSILNLDSILVLCGLGVYIFKMDEVV